MRKLLVFAAILAVPIAAAEAKCTKKSLNGTWAMGGGTASGVGVMSGGTYNVTISGSAISFTLTSFSSTKCRGSGNGLFSGTPVTVKVASEGIATSAAKPNHLLVTVIAGGGAFQLPMQRQ